MDVSSSIYTLTSSWPPFHCRQCWSIENKLLGLLVICGSGFQTIQVGTCRLGGINQNHIIHLEDKSRIIIILSVSVESPRDTVCVVGNEGCVPGDYYSVL